MMKTHPGITGRIRPTMPIRMSPTPPAMRTIFFKWLPSFAALQRLENFYLLVFSTQISC